MSTVILRGKDELSQMINSVYRCVNQTPSGRGWSTDLDDGDGETMYDSNGNGYGDPYVMFSQST